MLNTSYSLFNHLSMCVGNSLRNFLLRFNSRKFRLLHTPVRSPFRLVVVGAFPLPRRWHLSVRRISEMVLYGQVIERTGISPSLIHKVKRLLNFGQFFQKRLLRPNELIIPFDCINQIFSFLWWCLLFRQSIFGFK